MSNISDDLITSGMVGVGVPALLTIHKIANKTKALHGTYLKLDKLIIESAFRPKDLRLYMMIATVSAGAFFTGRLISSGMDSNKEPVSYVEKETQRRQENSIPRTRP